LKALRIGTRGSALALWQARSIGEALRAVAGVQSELVIVKTSGDKFQQTRFSEIGTKGVFIKELEDALLERRVDLAVHSMKDVPTEIPGGLTIAAICKRQDVRDALLSTSGASLDRLRAGAKVGTSSLRRKSQLLYARSDLQILDLRGNVDTRIEKLKRGDYDAIVLAKAGLDRLGLSANITEVLPTDVCLPAAGQGAIGIEARAEDAETLGILAALNDAETRSGVEAERAALAGLEGGCQVSIGAWGRVENGKLVLEVAVLSPDGAQRMREKSWGAPEDAVSLGERVAAKMLDKGAAAMLAREGRGTRA
jgi:hydroxymethylbilane synthase